QRLYFIFSGAPVSGVNTNQINNAASNDYAVVFVGTAAHSNAPGAYKNASEGKDRNTLKLPNNQEVLINAVAEKNPNTIVVIQAVGYVDVSRFKGSVKAILYSSYNGQYQGDAMTAVLFGGTNPSGRLTATWYADESQLPAIADYTVKPDAAEDVAGRTYMFFDGDVQYPFGYGLSYADFSVENISFQGTYGWTHVGAEPHVTADGTFNIIGTVKNNSNRAGAQVVQVYIGAPDAADSKDIPAKQLKGFARVEVAANGSQSFSITMNVSDFSAVHANGGLRTVTPGQYKIWIGGHSADPAMIEKTVTVTAAAPKLQTVTLESEKVRLIAGRTMNTELTIALTDESFITAADAAVTYTSNRPAVAAVSGDGVVTALGTGVAAITASVTKDGVTKTASFAVVVEDKAYVDDIRADGQSIPGFHFEKYSYSVMLPEDYAGAPAVSAVFPAGMTVTYTQAAAVPGTATVKAEKGGLTATYTVRFFREDNGPTRVLAKWSAHETTVTAPNGSQPNLYADWKMVDGGVPVDLTVYDPGRLFLEVTMTLGATNPANVNLANAFTGGALKLRSPNTGAGNQDENNWGWNVTASWGLALGENRIKIPLAAALDMLNNDAPYNAHNEKGLIDWTRIQNLICYIDSVSRNEYAGVTFTMTLSDVQILYDNEPKPPVITTLSLPDGTAGIPYSHTLTAKSNLPVTWELDSGSLPEGLTLSAAGVLSGPPAAAGAFAFTVRAANSAGTDTKELLLTIEAPPQKIIYGDVNGDDAVGVTDARLVLQHLVDKITLTPEQFNRAAVREAGKVEITDARLILQYIVEKITVFPREAAAAT
ncbi:MAG: glycoside hydrolase family 3 C-terminal domain-containing protein, partial [Oscillospiraceae bacterium]|nr:glycoside hydrolase family 3 C-terminal domain-containing protein [Oscillospiraceae bacterium]